MVEASCSTLETASDGNAIARKRKLTESSSESSSYSSSSGTLATSDEEQVDDEFCEVGLHVFKRQEVLGGERYRIEAMLGQGNFSKVFLCSGKEQIAAVKVYKASPKYAEFALQEVKMLEAVNTYCKSETSDPRNLNCSFNVVRLLEHFVHEAKHCSHKCLVLEPMGPSILDIAAQVRKRQLPFQIWWSAARDALSGLDALHRMCGIVHTDIKPENILAYVDPEASFGPFVKRQRTGGGHLVSFGRCQEAQARRLMRSALGRTMSTPIKFALTDLGNSCFANSHISDYIQTCEYKAPEVLLGAGYDCSTDFWSLACTLFECATGYYLLDPRRTQVESNLSSNEFADALGNRGTQTIPLEEEHMAQIAELLGGVPEPMLRRGKLTGELFEHLEPSCWLLKHMQAPLDSLQHCSLCKRLKAHLKEHSEIAAASNLLGPMLAAEPANRPAAASLLETWKHISASLR